MSNWGWTEERKAKQAQWMRENRPWEKSTGPKTDAGKDAAKYNAFKHGARCAALAALLKTLKAQEKWLKSLDFPDQTP